MNRVIELTKGFVAVISASDFRRVNRYNWHVHHSRGSGRKHGQPYARATVNGRKVYLHRFIFGDLEPNVEVDHRNYQTLDCRRENLEVVTPQQNKSTRRK